MPSLISAVRASAAASAVFGAVFGALITVSPPAHATSSQQPVLQFIGETTIPTGTLFDGTEVGGLSGIDFDAAHNLYYAISDDRSAINPARFYTLNIDLSDGTLDNGDVSLQSVVTLLDTNGQPFAAGTVDPESIRYNAARGSVFWTSEGDANQLLPPFVREATLTGEYVRQLQTPAAVFYPTADQSTGIRNNLAFESLSFSGGGLRAVTATENALYQDGPAASLTERSPSRLLEYNLASGKPRREFVYLTKKVIQVPDPATGFANNGLVEILYIAPNRFLTVERSYANNRGNVIKVYVSDISRATDVRSLESIEGADVRPVRKTQIANFRDYGIVADNVEGVTYGPTLPDGRQTLIFVSDNNFSPTQTTQFLAFAFKPGALQAASAAGRK